MFTPEISLADDDVTKVSNLDNNDVKRARTNAVTPTSAHLSPHLTESDSKSARRSISDVTTPAKRARHSRGSRLARMSTDDFDLGLTFARVSLDLMQVRCTIV